MQCTINFMFFEVDSLEVIYNYNEISTIVGISMKVKSTAIVINKHLWNKHTFTRYKTLLKITTINKFI